MLIEAIFHYKWSIDFFWIKLFLQISVQLPKIKIFSPSEKSISTKHHKAISVQKIDSQQLCPVELVERLHSAFVHQKKKIMIWGITSTSTFGSSPTFSLWSNPSEKVAIILQVAKRKRLKKHRHCIDQEICKFKR